MKILVTGIGLIGSSLVDKLRQNKNYDIVGVDNLSFTDGKYIDRRSDDNWEFWQQDIDELSDTVLNNYFDVLVSCHCSNIIYAQNNPVETYENNCIKTIKLFQKFKGKIVYTSTCSVYNSADIYPTPETARIHTYNGYDGSKYATELFLQTRGNYTTLRLSNVFSERQNSDNPFSGVVGKFIENICIGTPIKIYGGGEQTRDYTYISDTICAIEKAIELPAQNDVFNIASGVETSIHDLIITIEEISGKKAIKEYVEPRNIDNISRRWIDVKKAKQLLNWQPKVSLTEGIEQTIQWMKKEYNL
jgi:UDP-glucose 4-epimerase